MGSVFHAPVSRELDTLAFLGEAREAGFATVAAVPSGGGSPELLHRGKLVVVVGTEGGGSLAWSRKPPKTG